MSFVFKKIVAVNTEQVFFFPNTKGTKKHETAMRYEINFILDGFSLTKSTNADAKV